MQHPDTASLESAARLGSFFLAGALIRMYSDFIPARGWFAAAAGATLAILWPLEMVGTLGALPLAYLTLYAGAVLPFTQLGRTNDISYGVYVYAFPVQQLLVLAGAHHLGMPVYITLTLVVITPVAWASWLLVERPAMRFKSFGRPTTPRPGEGLPEVGRGPSRTS